MDECIVGPFDGSAYIAIYRNSPPGSRKAQRSQARRTPERAAKDCAALLRSEAGRIPYDRELSDLIGELSTQSEAFRGHWAAHNVRLHNKGVKRFNHPVVGELELNYNRVELPADPGLIIAYTAEPGSRSAEAFSLLASWAATEEAHETAGA